MKTATTKFEALKGQRPSSLSINKYSHLIRKPSSSFTKAITNNPIITYTESPKIIHTKPRDFMALVQSLTGMSNSSQHLFHDASSSHNSASLTSDASNNRQHEQQHEEDVSVKEHPFSPSNMDFSDFPIFTPNSVFTYTGSPFGFLSALLSPSGMEFMKELPEY
ncbi:VQ motif-containing protein 8, chloroplastic [Vigna radiata var. radiata]|uniref:VQ motif-containing protein 8, chloroplastic n=1 Tax=Vigna radiata var. radiata TaxID=3916 RepID=A0A1S3VQX3_VIGRR|nr:VQ motif-containing protein 8, chloroplastic [Vigna radiata var. radiata]